MAKLLKKSEEPTILWSDDPDQKVGNKKDKKNLDIIPENYLMSIRREKNHRGGKTVTVIFGEFEDNINYFKKLSKKLRKGCGSGGTFKVDAIEIQGDFVDRVIQLLEKEGFKTKVVGG